MRLKEAHHNLTAVIGGYDQTHCSIMTPLNARNWGDLQTAWQGGSLGSPYTGYKPAEEQLRSLLTSARFRGTALEQKFNEMSGLWENVDQAIDDLRVGRQVNPRKIIKLGDDVDKLKHRINELMAKVDEQLKTQLNELRDSARQLRSLLRRS